MGTRRDREGGLSASAQKRINSTRSNGLTAKRAHRRVAPRGREGAGEGREQGRGVGEGVRTGEGEGQEEWARWGEEEERKNGERDRGRAEGRGQDRTAFVGASLQHPSPAQRWEQGTCLGVARPRCRPPPASTLPLSRQGAARPCAVPTDLRATSLGLK